MKQVSTKNVKLEFYSGTDNRLDKNRKVDFFDACSCGCDTKEDPDLLGYLSGSRIIYDSNEVNAFTLYIYDQETYDQMRKIFPLQ